MVADKISSRKTSAPSKKNSSLMLLNIYSIAFSRIAFLRDSYLYYLFLSSLVRSWAMRVLIDEYWMFLSKSSSISGCDSKYANTGIGSCLMKNEYIFCKYPKQVSFFYLFFRISKLRATIYSRLIYTSLCSSGGIETSSSSSNLNNLSA